MRQAYTEPPGLTSQQQQASLLLIGSIALLIGSIALLIGSIALLIGRLIIYPFSCDPD